MRLDSLTEGGSDLRPKCWYFGGFDLDDNIISEATGNWLANGTGIKRTGSRCYFANRIGQQNLMRKNYRVEDLIKNKTYNIILKISKFSKIMCLQFF